MIDRSIVFVLGAGASMPYGLPSGAQLRQMLCGMANTEDKFTQLLPTIADVYAANITDFARQFQRSNIASIDAFLAKRGEYTEIGKLCIAALLCDRERSDSVIPPPVEDDWYSHLWNLLVRDARSPVDLAQNHVKFVSFNYDRSLEYFLHISAKNTFGASDEVAETALRGIDILHVYGELGRFNHLPRSNSRQYFETLNSQWLQIAAAGIQVMPEARENSPPFNQARDWCAQADVIAFLGFGFDHLNLTRLGLPAVLKWRRDNGKTQAYIAASAYGRTDAETDASKRQVCPEDPWHVMKSQSLWVLRNSSFLQ
jgi:hypothetical protein